MLIKINEILSTNKSIDFKSWDELTSGRYPTGYNKYKGMPYHAEVRQIIPSLNFHINPFKEDGKLTPWRDIVLQEEGMVIYNGDNKVASKRAQETAGNKLTLSVIDLYKSKNKYEREKAPPIIVTRTISIKNKTGFRQFIGFGIITSAKLVQQFEKETSNVFSNYQFVVELFKLNDGEYFDWTWIDDRRDESIDIRSANLKAPSSWREWIRNGSSVLDKVRLEIRQYHILSSKEQMDMPLRNRQLLDDLLKIHYPDPIRDGVKFEAMASFITNCFFRDSNYYRGWITRGTADRGVDFVGRLKIGDSGMSQTSLIVLGQSKRYKSQISGEKVTRIASRMTRGYIGVVVTLDTFSEHAQREIHEDKLPIILINGKKVSELLLNYMNEHRISLHELVEMQNSWSKENIGSYDYSTILHV